MATTLPSTEPRTEPRTGAGTELPPAGQPMTPQAEAQAAGLVRGRELDLFGFALLILRHLPVVLVCGVLGFAFMAVKMIRTPSRYASTAVMIIPQANVSSTPLGSQASLSAIDLVGGGYELYSDILSSRAVQDKIIHDLHLEKVYGTTDLQVLEATLAGATAVATQHDGLIRVTVEDTNPQRAADIANDYFRQLDALNTQLVLTSVGQQRAYLERELVREKDALADAEVALKQVQESTSGVTPDASASAGIGALDATRAQLRADEIRLNALLTGETESNPEVVRLRTEIAGLAGQVTQLQRGTTNSTMGTPTGQVPTQQLVYTRRLRDVRFHETLFDLLARQYESAKQAEARNPSTVEVLDPAVPSLHKVGPQRLYFSLVGGIAGLVVGMVLVLTSILVRAYLARPDSAEKMAQLRAVFRRTPRRA